MIAIIDGCGANITSVQFALERLGEKSQLTTDVNRIQSASHVILPGVGTARHAMTQLKKNNLIDVIRNLQQPVLGICLGMQLFYETSCEGDANCLSILSGHVTNLPQHKGLTIPHMGWNRLLFNDHQSPLMNKIKNGSFVYFVHSYVAPVNDHTIATADYGTTFSTVVQNKNFYGVQFHPEKSGETGAKLLQNFLEIE